MKQLGFLINIEKDRHLFQPEKGFNIYKMQRAAIFFYVRFDYLQKNL